jgi:hypothetical protein
MLISARSISLHAARILRPGVGGRVLASFERVCDLVTDSGEVVALVWGGIGDGPLNVVLSHGPGANLPAGAGLAVWDEGDEGRRLPDAATRLTLASPAHGSPIVIDLATAVPWNPQPDWDHLRAHRRQIAAGAEVIAGILIEAGWTLTNCGLPEAVCKQAAHGDAAAIRALVGLGPGLTPAGDDWLAGWLLAQRISRDFREPSTEFTAENAEDAEKTAKSSASLALSEVRLLLFAADRTTTLSRALLSCAAAGEADAAWHALLSALAEDPMTNLPIDQSTATILSHGATSGAAMLLGFCAGVSRLASDS